MASSLRSAHIRSYNKALTANGQKGDVPLVPFLGLQYHRQVFNFPLEPISQGRGQRRGLPEDFSDVVNLVHYDPRHRRFDTIPTCYPRTHNPFPPNFVKKIQIPPSIDLIRTYRYYKEGEDIENNMASMSPSGSVVGASGASPGAESGSPSQVLPPKNVAFELCFLDSPQYRARLPMRVQIYPHDNTESIITTVKNFYGLYAGPTGSKGVSFEDKEGITLIARYENFHNNMTVYVRVYEELTAEPTVYGHRQYSASRASVQPYHPSESFHTQHPAQEEARQTSRSPTRRSPSSHSSRGRRSDSAGSAGQKRRSRPLKIHTATSQADALSDHGNGYSSDEGALSTASGRVREQFGNTDISVENIVEGGRRKRAKFESCVRTPLCMVSSPMTSRLTA